MKVLVLARTENARASSRLNNNHVRFGLYWFFEIDCSANPRGVPLHVSEKRKAEWLASAFSRYH